MNKVQASLRALVGMCLCALLLFGVISPVLAQTPVKVPGAPDSVGRVALSGDGQWAVWADQDGDCCATVTPFVYLANLDTGSVTALNLHQTTGDLDLDLPNTVFPQVNGDATRIALLADGPDGSRRAEILLVIDRAGNEILRVTATDEFSDVAIFHEVAYMDPAGGFVAFSVLAETIRSSTPAGSSDIYTLPGNIFFPGFVESVYRVNTSNAEIDLVSLDTDGREPDEDAEVKGIGGNGRYVSFTSFATDLPDADGSCQLYARDMQSTTNGGSTLVSRDEAGTRISELFQCEGTDDWPDLSDDGSTVVFTESGASSADGEPHAFVWRRGSGSTAIPALIEEGGLALSGDKAWLAPSFESFARINIGSGDTDPAAFEISRPDLSDDGSVLLFFNDELAPPGEDGLWWTLSLSGSAPVDETDPSWPLNAQLEVQVNGNNVALDWPDASDNVAVTEYVLFRNDSEIQRISAPTSSSSDPGLADGGYNYRVEAVDAAGNQTTDGPTGTATVDTSDGTPPAWTNGDLTGKQVGNSLQVSLSWSVAVDGGSGLNQYILYRGSSEITRTGSQSFTDTVPQLDVYGYRVEAQDVAGNISSDGPTTIVSLTAPPVVVSLDETIKVLDEGAGGSNPVVLAIGVFVDEVIRVLDTPVVLSGIAVLVNEVITVTDDTADPLNPPSVGDDLIVINIPDFPLRPGSIFDALAGGWQPFTLVQAFLESEPVLVGQETADGEGNVEFTITVPMNFPPGMHTLVLVGTGADGNPRRLETPIEIFPRTYADAIAVPGPTIGDVLIWLLAALVLLSGSARLRRQQGTAVCPHHGIIVGPSKLMGLRIIADRLRSKRQGNHPGDAKH